MGNFDLGAIWESLLAPRTLWSILWGGLAMLTLALLILTRTRWGQARPLSKCAVLSLFAHILLIGYASLTQLIVPGKPARGDGEVEVELVEMADDPQTSQAHESEEQPESDLPPWEQLAMATPPVVDSPPLMRRETAAEIPALPAATTATAAVATHLPATGLPVHDVAIDVPGTAITQVNAATRRPMVEPARIENPRPRKTIPAPPVTPTTGPLARMSTAHPPLPLPQRDGAETPPRDRKEFADRLQRLAQEPNASEPADAISAPMDQTARATNRADTSWQSVDPAHTNTTQPAAEMTADSTDNRYPRAFPQPASIQTPNAVAARPAAAAVAVAASSTNRDESLAASYQIRMRRDREQLGQVRGGTRETEAAVQAALRWLASVQQEDGRWDARAYGGGARRTVDGEDRQGAGTKADMAATSLSLLAFHAAGETHLKGQHRKTVQRGLEYLLSRQAPDGNLADNATFFAKMYCHSMATLALSESYAMTRDERIRPYLERAIAFTVVSQHPTTGGWRYLPRDKVCDMSQFGWHVMSLKSAQAAGISVPENTRILMQRFLASCTAGNHGGLASYRPGERVSRPMTAEALVCRFFLQGSPSSSAVNEAADFLLQEPPGASRANLYYWYYGTLALFQLQDERWERWNHALQRQLLKTQRTDGPLAGSWDTDTVWGGCGGRVYTTAMATLSLEVYYRYLPLYIR